MDAADVLERLTDLGITATVNGTTLRLEPGSKVPPELLAEVKEHKPEILALLVPVSDGLPPPLDRPPQTEQELRRLYDHWQEPGAFSRWLDWAMTYMDPAETEGDDANP